MRPTAPCSSSSSSSSGSSSKKEVGGPGLHREDASNPVVIAPGSQSLHKASRVGELRESEEGSLLLLPFRCAAAQLGKASVSG